MSELKDINIVIKRIKELFFSINEALFIPDPSKLIQIEIGLQFAHIIDKNLVLLLTRISYHYDGRPQEVLAEIQVQNIFEISNLSAFKISDAEIKLPSHIISSLVGMSISHARALFAKALLGTPFQESIVQIANPSDIAKHFFPKMFEDQLAEERSHPKETSVEKS